jgi:hypothetical protein
MLRTSLSAPLGDDVFDEDPTVHKLQDNLADMFGKESGLWFPTGTQTNLAAIMAHCHERASEIIVGKDAHVTLWEGGNISTVAGVHPRQIAEDSFGRLDFDEIRDQWRDDSDDHWAKTAVRVEQSSINSFKRLTQHRCIGSHILLFVFFFPFQISWFVLRILITCAVAVYLINNILTLWGISRRILKLQYTLMVQEFLMLVLRLEFHLRRCASLLILFPSVYRKD